MSPEAEENAQALGDALLETWREDIARGRPAATPGLNRLMSDPVGVTRAASGDLARAALELKLIDRIGERRQYRGPAGRIGGKD